MSQINAFNPTKRQNYNTLPDYKLSALSKSNEIADNKFYVPQIIKSVFRTKKKLWKKEKMLVTQHFLLY